MSAETNSLSAAVANKSTLIGGIAIFFALLGAAGVLIDPAKGYTGILAAALFGLSIALGAAVFSALEGVAGARWWLPIKSAPKALMETLAVPCLALVVAITLGYRAIYPAAHMHGEGHALPHDKAWYLSPTLFVLRAFVLIALWLLLSAWLGRKVMAADGTSTATKALAKASAIFLVVLGPTLTIAYFDWGSSIEPLWYSTIYGVYGFAGALQAGVAAISIVVLLFLPEQAKNDRIRHDLGKLLFGFSTFWAYIWFCQYLLIWYSNIPEEVTYYIPRSHPDWSLLFWAVPLISWAIPFFVLLSARVKKHPTTLLQIACIALLGRFLDCFVMVSPTKGSPSAISAVGMGLAVLGLIAVVAVRSLRGTPPPSGAAEHAAAE